MLFLIAFIVSTRLSLSYPKEYLDGPKTKADFETWLTTITEWKKATLEEIKYDDYVYEKFLPWTQSSFIQPQMMMMDRYFFDIDSYEYTVDKYLDDLENRYGGIDSVLLWPGYPNIGIDNRNQYDLWKSMPGGIDGLKKMINDFHDRGVGVLFPFYPWDSGTRDEGDEGEVVIPKLLKELGADGFNCDTCQYGDSLFWDNSIKNNYPIAIEPEGGGVLETLYMNKMSWGYWDWTTPVDIPKVDMFKWLENRHMTNICYRWAKDKTDQIQHAFFNGCGYESWENVWSIWMGITDRNGELLRRVSAIERFFKDFLVSTWIPHFPTEQEKIFSSKFKKDNQVLFMLVNKDESKSSSGIQLKVNCSEKDEFYDVYKGEKISTSCENEKTAELKFDIEKNGISSVLQIPSSEVTEEFTEFLQKMKVMTKNPLSSYDNTFKYLNQNIVEIEKTPITKTAPEGMVEIPKTDSYNFIVSGIMIEGGDDGVDFQYPGESSPYRNHNISMKIDPFYIDIYPVTNEKYKQFITDYKYEPRDTSNYLRRWENGSFTQGTEKQPVTWVSIEDARAYCRAYKKRLPNEWEWQYSGQGENYFTYPWGNDFDEKKVPIPDLSRDPRDPDDVDKHLDSSSPFGVFDMVGNIWQFTNEFRDEHSRSFSLKGGSLYKPQGSKWYFPSTYKLTEHGKFLAMSDSYDRSGYVGFRCASDKVN